MLAVTGQYRICTTKCVTSPPLLACTVDGHTLLWKIGNKKSATFLFKKLPVTHVYQATIFAGQTVIFYRSVTDDRHLFRGLPPNDLQNYSCEQLKFG
jgi:hypothetical protein